MLYQLGRDDRIKINQVEIPDDYDHNSPNSIYNLSCQNHKAFKLDLTEIDLLCDGAMTDIMNFVPCTEGIIANQKIIDCLKEFNLPEYSEFPVNILNRGTSHQFLLFYVCQDILKLVDFTRSEIVVKNELKEILPCKLMDYSDYSKLFKQWRSDLNDSMNDNKDSFGFPSIGSNKSIIENKRKRIEKITYKTLQISENAISQFDLLYFSGKFYVSTKLKAKLEKLDATNMKFHESKLILGES